MRELGSNLGFLALELSVNKLAREKKGKRVKVGRMGWGVGGHGLLLPMPPRVARLRIQQN